MAKLDEIRKKIDSCDREILKFLRKRISLAREIAKLKKEKGADIYKPAREEEIIRRLKKLAGKDDSRIIEYVFRNIISSCRNIQKTLKISYLGPKATFTHQAAMKIFGKFCVYAPAESIAEVFEEIETDRCDYGVVPIENSTEGMVNHTLDMFINSRLKIVNEDFLAISHCLISEAGEKDKIKKIYSHSSVFGQCRDFVAKNLPRAEKKEVSSTSAAVAQAKKEKSSAAIASKFAAQIYDVPVLEDHIEDIPENYTRFLVLGKTMPNPSGKDKTSILFSLKDRPGALHDSLAPFKKNKINLTKIESRPSKKKAWEYFFFVDCDGHIHQKKIREAVDQLAKFCDTIKILGSYPAKKFEPL
ncbi:MAG: prephenate dehydratase [Elusimicrobia bacterium]|nr:prephenate dehydratase [Elusimicrobiota bacterium]